MLRAYLSLCLAILCCSQVHCETLEAPVTTPEVSQKTNIILMILPQYNFVDDEYTIPKVILSRGGYTVEVASASTREIALGADIIKVRPNLAVEQINVDRYDAVIMVGGYMSKKFFENKVLTEKMTEFNAKGKLICAMDNTPHFLAKWGLLKGVKATVNPSLARDFKNMGINYVDKNIVVDGNFITVDNYRFSDAFAGEILNALNKR